MKHLHFTQSIEALQGGGLGKAAVDLHRSFLDRGTESLMVSTYEQTPSDQIPNSFVGKRTGPGKCFYSREIRNQAADWAKTYDVFHGHGFYVYPNWAIGTHAIKNRKKLVYHAHGFLEPWILSRSKIPKRIAHFLFESRNFKYAQLWRALTLKEADQIRACGITAPIVIAANGIHLVEYDRPPPEEMIPEKSRKRILFLARIHPKKGLKLLLEVWPEFASKHKDWEIIVAGPDEGGHRGELELLTKSLNIEDSVSFVGTVTGDTKLAWLKSSDLFILPSYSEGFSVAILEAMACGLPVLGTTGCNFPELAKEDAGWIGEADKTSIATNLNLALMSSEADLKAMGIKGRSLVEKQYTWESIATKITDATDG